MVLSIVLSFVIGITSQTNESNVEITVQSGDTLWTLSEKYKGNLPHSEWITAVMNANNLNHPMIVSGDTLIIPTAIHAVDDRTQIVLAGNEE